MPGFANSSFCSARFASLVNSLPFLSALRGIGGSIAAAGVAAPAVQSTATTIASRCAFIVKFASAPRSAGDLDGNALAPALTRVVDPLEHELAALDRTRIE